VDAADGGVRLQISHPNRVSCSVPRFSSLADLLHYALDASPLARNDNLTTYKSWPSRLPRRQQARWLRLRAQHHLNRGPQALKGRCHRRPRSQRRLNRRLLLSRHSPRRPVRTYQLRAQRRIHNLRTHRLQPFRRLQPQPRSPRRLDGQPSP
jgi:hypothetical protein